MLWGVFWACSSPSIEEQTQVSTIELIETHSEDSKPALQIEKVQAHHLAIMLSAYKELEAYYGSVLSKEVKRIRFVGQDSPWKPLAEKHYCIDLRSEDSTEVEHIYYFANYCRSKSTLLRETNEVLFSYVDIQTCSDLCSCVMEKHVSWQTGATCLSYCESLTWEVTCESHPEVKNKCCSE